MMYCSQRSFTSSKRKCPFLKFGASTRLYLCWGTYSQLDSESYSDCGIFVTLLAQNSFHQGNIYMWYWWMSGPKIDPTGTTWGWGQSQPGLTWFAVMYHVRKLMPVDLKILMGRFICFGFFFFASKVCNLELDTMTKNFWWMGSFEGVWPLWEPIIFRGTWSSCLPHAPGKSGFCLGRWLQGESASSKPHIRFLSHGSSQLRYPSLELLIWYLFTNIGVDWISKLV